MSFDHLCTEKLKFIGYRVDRKNSTYRWMSGAAEEAVVYQRMA